MTIRVLSFDFDDSLFHRLYASSKEKDVIASNRPFLDAIKADNYLYAKNFVFVGSNRQSKKINDSHLYNSRFEHIGCCFSAIRKIADYLSAELNTFLLADLYADLKHGTSFDLAIKDQDAPLPETAHADSHLDDTKATLLYAQIHKIAHMFVESSGLGAESNKNIVFDFYDDRDDILDALEKCYTKYSELLPSTVTLRLHRYAGNEVTSRTPIKGTGFIDVNYTQTVKDMVSIHKTILPNQSQLFIAPCITPELLTNRTPYRKAVMPNKKQESFLQFGAYSFFSSVNYRDSYNKIWSQTYGNSNVKKIKALLMDYTKENSLLGSFTGLALSGHWNRHHVTEVSEIIARDYDSADELVAELDALQRTPGGSLDRRLKFIKEQISVPERSFTLEPFN